MPIISNLTKIDKSLYIALKLLSALGMVSFVVQWFDLTLGSSISWFVLSRVGQSFMVLLRGEKSWDVSWGITFSSFCDIACFQFRLEFLVPCEFSGINCSILVIELPSEIIYTSFGGVTSGSGVGHGDNAQQNNSLHFDFCELP